MTKPDWSAIKSEYITTDISYRKLAEKHGVSFRTLGDRAKREGWTGERDMCRHNVVSQTVQKVTSRTSRSNADKLLRVRNAADSMSGVIERIFDDVEQFNRHIVQTSGSMECRLMDKVDTKAIKDLTGALKDLACVVRNVYDLPTIQERAAMDIAAERMRLEQAKAAIGADEGDETGVVEITPVLEDEDNA